MPNDELFDALDAAVVALAELYDEIARAEEVLIDPHAAPRFILVEHP